MWFLVACAHSPGSGAATQYRDAIGTVAEVVPAAFAVVPDADDSQRFCLTGPLVSDGLRVDGARVRFSGQSEPIPANERRACVPFTLTALAPAPAP